MGWKFNAGQETLIPKNNRLGERVAATQAPKTAAEAK
jgi:hypothetical protein